MSVTLNDILPRLATAGPEKLAQVAAVLDGGESLEDMRLYEPSDPELWWMLNVERHKNPRMTVWNMIKSEKLPVVKTRRAETGSTRRQHGYKVPKWGVVQYLRGVQ